MRFKYDGHGWYDGTTEDDNGNFSTDVPPPTIPQARVVGEIYPCWGANEWLLVPYVEPLPVEPIPQPWEDKRITKRAFQARFPKTADGISTKFSLMTMFMNSDSYAASLGVSESPLFALRALITEGQTQLNASLCVDYNEQEAANFTALLMQPIVPAIFRLTAEERSKMLNDPIEERERYKGP